MTRRGATVAVVGSSVVVVLISVFVWVYGLLLGSEFMASTPSRANVATGAVLRVVAVLIWGVPVAIAWQELGRRAARTTALVLGACLVAGLTLAAVIGVW